MQAVPATTTANINNFLSMVGATCVSFSSPACQFR